MENDREPRFPPELEREIFETTALLHPTAIPVLLVVARRVLVWLEPSLYRVVGRGMRIMTAKRRAIMEAIQSRSKPTEFFRRAVRHLCVSVSWDMEEVTTLLSICTDVVDLVCFGSSELLPLLENIRPRRLTTVPELFSGNLIAIEATHPLFTNTTHLHVCNWVVRSSRISAIIPALPSITHLSLNNKLAWFAVDTLLTASPSLEILINVWGPKSRDSARHHASNIPFQDVRFVIGFMEDYWVDWEAGANGLPDFWTRAEEFVMQKRSGEVEATHYFMD